MDPVVMQRDNEHGRLAVDGHLAEGGEHCTFLVIHQRLIYQHRRTWGFYPHGAGKLGVWLPEEHALAVARFILAGAE